MPLVETPLPSQTVEEANLIKELSAELTSPKPAGQPLIDIRQMNRRGLKHVYVIWDRWENCDSPTRATVIRETFRQVRGEEYERAISATVPVTVQEAIDIGLLPYEISPIGWTEMSPKDQEHCRSALLSEGGIFLEYTSGPELRFLNEPDVQAALNRLRLRAPSINWRMVVSRNAAN